VGIVTPYRGQRDTIREMLINRFGPDELSRVRVETIDSFQGKQLDVVILSLTRASGGSAAGTFRGQNVPATAAAAAAAAAAAGSAGADGRQMLQLNRAGVGFLSDVRRMNVAITRARLACLILGRVATLQQDAAWSALVADAASRGCLFQVRERVLCLAF
jgi:senataxin